MKFKITETQFSELNDIFEQITANINDNYNEQLAEDIMLQNEIDYINGLIDEEELNERNARCTKATKKTSSTRKNKKWMQCVKNPDGDGYKRIHWGEKGVKVTGDSGDTKRKKSFRARHNCKNAKKGTPKYMACKDW